jgi:hypothetical protein
MIKTNHFIGRIGSVVCGALLGYAAHGQPSVSVDVNLPAVEIRTESDFYEPLTSCGEWVVVGSYGRCWRPARVETSWRPYCNGSWQRTEAGWYWVSDEPWAWATYHYGRWNFTADFGWYWVPQTQWAPAWVSWHSGGGYVGWAPLYPSGVTIISPRAYVFVQERRFMEPVRPTTVVVNTTVIINQTVVHQAPAPAYIEKASGRKVQAVPVQQLRHQTEAAVVAQRRSPAAKTVQPAVRNQAQPVVNKAVTTRAPSQVEKPAALTHESAAPAPKFSKAPSAAESKPAARPEAKPESHSPAADKQPAREKAGQPLKKQEKPAPSAERKPEQAARERPAQSEKREANPADQNHESKGKE